MARTDTRVVIIRHGESRAQAGGFVSGHDTCTGLTDLGRRQAGALHDRLLASGELDPVDAVYTSILPRAVETATILGPVLGDFPPRQECEWCEIHPGAAEGLTWDEVRARFPLEGDPDDAFERMIPGAESWAELTARVGTGLRRIAAEHVGERVVVVGHGGTVGASFSALGELPLRQVIRLTREAANTSITEWRGSESDWRLIRFNDAGHLAAVS